MTMYVADVQQGVDGAAAEQRIGASQPVVPAAADPPHAGREQPRERTFDQPVRALALRRQHNVEPLSGLGVECGDERRVILQVSIHDHDVRAARVR